MIDSRKIEEAMRAFRAELLQACAPPRGRPDATPVVVVTSAIVAGQHLRDSLVAIMAESSDPGIPIHPTSLATDGIKGLAEIQDGEDNPGVEKL